MTRWKKTRGIHALACALGFVASVLFTRSALAVSNPDFDAVTWTPLSCEVPDLISHTSPSNVDFVGNATFAPAYFAHDSNYLYFRYRLDGNPNGSGGFAQVVWTALMQVPSGNPFQYQYQLSLNGKDDTIEVWKNTVAMDIDFSPLFHDDAEVKLFSQDYDFSSGSTVNTSPLARSLPVTDGSSFGGPDYFVDFAFPVSALIAQGAITTAADLDTALFFPATATDPNNYNKGHLNCPFLPVTDLTVEKSVAPATVPVNAGTPVVYTIDVTNTGSAIGKGIVITDPALPAFLSNVMVTVSSTDASVTWMVDSTNPLEVKVPILPMGSTVTVRITADAAPHCSDQDFTNVATAEAVNAMPTSGSALLDIQTGGGELCDGMDNDCDGQVDEGGDSLCDDGNACNGSETCGGAAGCQAGMQLDCNDHDPCTTDGCEAQSGCTNGAAPNGTTCNDGNACTQNDSCQGGSCGGTAVVCAPSDQCHSAGTCDPSTGVCSNPAAANGTGCNDGNACTQTDTCQGGACSGGNPVTCTASDQCHTAGACDPSTGVCSNPAAANGTGCNDSNACTQTDTCQGGACSGGDPVTCVASDQCHAAGTCDPSTGMCSDPAKEDGTGCDDGNACSRTDTCQGGVCSGADPVVCTASDQCHVAGSCDPETGTCSNPTATDGTGCNDGNPCTTGDACEEGSCESTPIPGCRRCETGADCADGTSCTADVCNEEGVCENESQPGCIPCTTDAQCEDQNACTNQDCGDDGSCQFSSIPGCRPCTVAADCDDEDSCTVERCTGGVCGHDQAPECLLIPEDCDDGVDNDGDGLIDCADSDCATAPNCQPREICGNCLDDDGDGMVDYEDADCCSGEPLWLNIRKLRLKPGSGKSHRNRIRLKVRYAGSTPALFDPMTQDTSLQIADANGQLFCTTVPAKYWKHPRRRLYRFRDKRGVFAGGLKNGRFKMKRSGKIMFNTRGKRMSLRASDGKNVLVTVRVGEQCLKEMRNLRTTKKKGLVFP